MRVRTGTSSPGTTSPHSGYKKSEYPEIGLTTRQVVRLRFQAWVTAGKLQRGEITFDQAMALGQRQAEAAYQAVRGVS